MLRIEQFRHMCSVAFCKNITDDCYMLTKLDSYANAIYICPECAKTLAERVFKDDKATVLDKEVKPTEEPKKAIVEDAPKKKASK